MDVHQQNQQQAQQANLQDSQDLVNRVVAGVRESFKTDFDSLKESIEEVKNQSRIDLDDLRVEFNLRERSFKQVVKDGKTIFPRAKQQAPGATPKVTQNENVSVDANQSRYVAATGQQGHPLGDPFRNQAQQQQQQQYQEYGSHKRKRWVANQTELDTRDLYRSHIVLKFNRRHTHTDAVYAMGKIGRYLSRRIIPTKEPYTDPANAHLSRKYVLEFTTPEDVKSFRKAAQALKRQEGHQGYSTDAHLTEQQKLVRADIWSEYASYMEQKQLPMHDGSIQLVFSITNPWIVLNNGPQITCQEFRTKYASQGTLGNCGFTTDTYISKRMHQSQSTDTLNTIGTAPTPKLIDMLQALFSDDNPQVTPPTLATEQQLPVNNLADIPIAHVTSTLQSSIPLNVHQTANENLRDISPVILTSQQEQDNQNEVFVQQVLGDLATEQANDTEIMNVEQLTATQQQETLAAGPTPSPDDTTMNQPTTPKTSHDAVEKRKTTPLKVHATLNKPQTDKMTANERKQKNKTDREAKKAAKLAAQKFQSEQNQQGTSAEQPQSKSSN